MNDKPSTHPDYSRLLTVAGVCSLCAVAATNFLHGSPTLVFCVGIGALLVSLMTGLFVRSRFQLGLRSLILLLTIAAVLMGLFGSRMNEARIQKRAVESVMGLRVAGGVYTDPYSDVRYDYCDLDSDFFTTQGGWLLPIWVVDFLGRDFFFAANYADIQNQDLSAEDSLDDVQLEQFTSLYISNCKLSDGAFQRVLQQKQLRDLSLVDIELNDDQLAEIAEHLPKLTRLHFGYARVPSWLGTPQLECSVTNAGLRHLVSLSELTELTIDRTKANGKCLSELTKFRSLQHLGCSGLSMAKADVHLLKEFRSLKSVTMYDTCVDEESIPILESLNLEWVAFTVTDKSRVEEIQNRIGKPIFAVH